MKKHVGKEDMSVYTILNSQNLKKKSDGYHCILISHNPLNVCILHFILQLALGASLTIQHDDFKLVEFRSYIL